MPRACANAICTLDDGIIFPASYLDMLGLLTTPFVRCDSSSIVKRFMSRALFNLRPKSSL